MLSKDIASIFCTANQLDESESELEDNEDISEEDDNSIDPYPEDSEYLDEIDVPLHENAIISKDKLYEYSTNTQRSNRRINGLNLFTAHEGLPRQLATRISSPFDSLKIFITSDIIGQIQTSTNYSLETPIIEKEFWVWIAANLFLGISKSKNASVDEMFSTEFGIPFLQQRNFCN